MPVTEAVTSPVTPSVSTAIRTLERLVDVLQRELAAARDRETLLLQMLSQLQQQNQRLLEAPRRIPPLQTLAQPSGPNSGPRHTAAPASPRDVHTMETTTIEVTTGLK